MKYLIIFTMLAISACTNDTQRVQNTRTEENSSLHTIGYIGDTKIQIGFADIKE